jgi:hypothetical protein
VTATTPLRELLPGSWYAVLGAGALVLLPPEEKRRVPAVWDRVDEGAGFDEVLDALITDGLRDLSGFALASVRDGDARVVIRGPVTAVLTTDDGEEVRVEGAAAATWVEREVRHVVALRVAVDGEPVADEAPYLLRDGLARASEVREPVSAAHPEPTVPLVPESPVEVPVEVPEEPDLPETELVAMPPGSPGAVARLVLSHGEVVDVDRPVLLGRDPHPDAAGDGEPRLVVLPSPSREISATHLEVRPGAGPDVGTVVATDLGSTNGTVVVQPGMPREELAAGVPTPLLAGAVVDLGDGISIEVVQP